MDVDPAEAPATRVHESVRLVRSDDDDVAAAHQVLSRPVRERRLAFEEEEKLGVYVLVEARPLSGRSVDDDHGRWYTAVVVADELTRRLNVVASQMPDHTRLLV